MKDLVHVRIMEAKGSVSKVSEMPMISLKLEPLEPLVSLDGEEIRVMYSQFLNEATPIGETRGKRLAQLRHALHLEVLKSDPLQAFEEPVIGSFSQVEIEALVEQELLVSVALDELRGAYRPFVDGFFRLRKDA